MRADERVRLERVVFGPPGRHDGAEVVRATARLRLLMAREAGPARPERESAPDDAPRGGRHPLLVAGAAVLAGAAVVGILILAADPRPVASLEIFSRSQTTSDVDAGGGVRGALASTVRQLVAPPGVTAVAYRDNPLDVCLSVRGRSACVSQLHFRTEGIRVAGYRWGPTGDQVVRVAES